MDYRRSVRQISLFIFCVFLFCSAAGRANAEADPSGNWKAAKVLVHSVPYSVSEAAELFPVSEGELLSLALHPDGEGRLLFLGIVYPCAVNPAGEGAFSLFAGGESLLFTQEDEQTLHCTIQDDVTVVLKKVQQLRFPKGTLTKAEDLLAEEKAVQEKIARVRELLGGTSFSFNEEQTAAMSLYMLHGRYLLDQNGFIGMAFDKGGTLPNLVRSEVDYSGGLPKVGVYTVLDRHVNANFLTRQGNTLYYIRTDRETGTSSLAALELQTGDITHLTEEWPEMSYLQFRNGLFYFTGEEHRLYCADSRGKGLRTVLDRAVYEPYFLSDDWLLYQDGEDEGFLRLFYLPEEVDIQITDCPGRHPILACSKLYFAVPSPDGGFSHLSCIDLNRPDPDLPCVYEREDAEAPVFGEFSIYHGQIYGCNQAAVPLENWKSFTDAEDGFLRWRNFAFYETCRIEARVEAYSRNVRDLFLTDDASGRQGGFRHVY